MSQENKPHVVLRKFNCSVLGKDFAAKAPYEPIKDVDPTYIGALVKSGFLKSKGSKGEAADETLIEPEDGGSVMSMEDFESEGNDDTDPEDTDLDGTDSTESNDPASEDTSSQDEQSALDDLDKALADELADSPENETDANAVTDDTSKEGVADEATSQETEVKTEEESEAASSESAKDEPSTDSKKTPADALVQIENVTDKKALIPIAKYFDVKIAANTGDANYKKALVKGLEALVNA